MDYPNEYKKLFDLVSVYSDNGQKIDLPKGLVLDNSTNELFELCKEIQEENYSSQTVCFT